MNDTNTATIRNQVETLAFSARAIWPNGLGFTWRGWEYSCRGRDRWVATKGDWIGKGETPTDAKANAYKAAPDADEPWNSNCE